MRGVPEQLVILIQLARSEQGLVVVQLMHQALPVEQYWQVLVGQVGLEAQVTAPELVLAAVAVQEVILVMVELVEVLALLEVTVAVAAVAVDQEETPPTAEAAAV